MENPYRVLGVSPQMSKDEIKHEYRKLCRIYHPDSATGNAKKFSEIAKAWEQINSYHNSPIKRRRWHHVSLFTIKEVG